MLIDREAFKRYPHSGKFYEVLIIPAENITDPPITKEVVYYDGECDIQQSGAMGNDMLVKAGYAIYFPMPKDDNGQFELKIQKGASFDGMMYGQRVNGDIKGIFPSELGGVVAYVEDTDVE